MEQWKDIPSYEGLYQASNLGKVRNRYKNILKPSNHRQGYRIIVLSDNYKRKSYMVHRLVLKAFLGESELECNHKNGIKNDNRLKNLEYCTSSENKLHAYNTGLMFKIGNSYKKC